MEQGVQGQRILGVACPRVIGPGGCPHGATVEHTCHAFMAMDRLAAMTGETFLNAVLGLPAANIDPEEDCDWHQRLVAEPDTVMTRSPGGVPDAARIESCAHEFAEQVFGMLHQLNTVARARHEGRAFDTVGEGAAEWLDAHLKRGGRATNVKLN